MTCSVEMAGPRGVIALDEDHVIMALDYAAASKDYHTMVSFSSRVNVPLFRRLRRLKAAAPPV
jgi:hypothetical protein